MTLLTDKKRVEIIVERSLLDTMVELVDDVGATGYTVVPCLSGRGRSGPWRSGDLSPAFDRVYILVIASAEIADTLVERIHAYLGRYSAVVCVSDGQVVRGERF